MRLKSLLLAAAIAVAAPLPAVAQTTPIGSAFTYQGELAQAGTPATGNFDFRFTLYGGDTGGSPIGPAVERQATAVSGGRFTANLDFGPTAFDSGARWLEIAVRAAGASTYEVLSPRQRVTPSPISLRTESAATADAALVAAAAPWSGLTGIPQGFVDNVDNDLLAALNCPPGQTVARATGDAWACVPRTTGTLTSILFSFPFEVAQSANPLTASGVVGLQDNSIGSQFIADGSITAADVNATQVQRRVTGTCGDGQVITAIAQDGSVSCTAVPQPTRTTPYPSNIYGTIVDLALNPSGVPFGLGISAGTPAAPQLVRCGNTACTSLPSVSTLDTGADLTQGLSAWSIAQGASGPVALLSRGDIRSFALVQCMTQTCSTVVNRSLEPAAGPGADIGASSDAVYVPSDNRAVAAYAVGTALHLAKCSNAACDAVTSQNLGVPEAVYSPVILPVPGSSELIIAGGSGRLHFGVCAPGSNCASALYVNELAVAGAASIRQITGFTPPDQRPVFAFVDDAGKLFVGRCGAPGGFCLDATITQPLGTSPVNADSVRLIEGDSSLAILVMSRTIASGLATTTVHRCADADCGAFSSTVPLQPTAPAPVVPAVRSRDGTPLIYTPNGFIKCGAASCE